jgi:hypothetical protein
VAVDDKMVAELLPKEVGVLLTGAAGSKVVITYEPFDVENKGEVKVSRTLTPHGRPLGVRCSPPRGGERK